MPLRYITRMQADTRRIRLPIVDGPV